MATFSERFSVLETFNKGEWTLLWGFNQSSDCILMLKQRGGVVIQSVSASISQFNGLIIILHSILSVYQSIHPYIYNAFSPIYSSIYLTIHPYIYYLSICLTIHPYI